MSGLMKIVIGYDGSESADAAIQDLRRAGLPPEAEASVICAADVAVFEDGFALPITPAPLPLYLQRATARAAEIRAQAMGHAQTMAERGAHRLKDIFPNWRVHAEPRAESPAWALVHKAESWGADLIVVGASGHSSFERFIGSVSQLVVIHAPCTVRIARKYPRGSDAGTRLILGIDGSPGSEKTARAVLSRHWKAPTEIRVVTSLHHHLPVKIAHLTPAEAKTESASAAERQAAVEMAEKVAAKLRNGNTSCTALVDEGDPKKVLLEEAEAWNADCVFVGARGLSPVRRFFLGSISMAVAARAHCSVEIVR